MLTLLVGLFLIGYGYLKRKEISGLPPAALPELAKVDFERFLSLEKRAMVGLICAGAAVVVLPLSGLRITSRTGEDVSTRSFMILGAIGLIGFMIQTVRAGRILKLGGLSRKEAARRLKEVKEKPWIVR